MKIFLEGNDKQRIYVDVGDGNEVVRLMMKNSIFVEAWNGNVATINTAQLSLQHNARSLGVLMDYYRKNGWEVSEESQSIVTDMRHQAAQERLRWEMEKIEEEKKRSEKKIPTQQFCRVRVRRGSWFFGL